MLLNESVRLGFGHAIVQALPGTLKLMELARDLCSELAFRKVRIADDVQQRPCSADHPLQLFSIPRQLLGVRFMFNNLLPLALAELIAQPNPELQYLPRSRSGE